MKKNPVQTGITGGKNTLKLERNRSFKQCKRYVFIFQKVDKICYHMN